MVTDASEEVLRHYQLDNQVSTAGKKVGNFESVFSGEYGFANGGDWRPDALKGTSANGGSLCLEHRGDTLNTDGNLLVIHGAAAGPDTISLPVGVSATPLGGGTASTGTLNLNFSRVGETQWFQLSQSSQGAKVSGSPPVKVRVLIRPETSSGLGYNPKLEMLHEYRHVSHNGRAICETD